MIEKKLAGPSNIWYLNQLNMTFELHSEIINANGLSCDLKL